MVRAGRVEQVATETYAEEAADLVKQYAMPVSVDRYLTPKIWAVTPAVSGTVPLKATDPSVVFTFTLVKSKALSLRKVQPVHSTARRLTTVALN
jgi:hypothetical protein